MATVEQLLPPFGAGDRLSREAFLRIWEAHPEIKRAELIGGIVYMPSPVAIEHGDMDGIVGGWMQYFTAYTPGTDSGHNTTSFVLDDAPQPDVNLRILPEYGGGSRVEDHYLAGIPELIAEVSLSSAAYDLHVKYDLYQAARIPEYLAVLVYEREIRWHALVDGVYQIMPPDADGIWRSKIFPGLWLDGAALWAGNKARMFSKLQEGIQSPEHQAFVAKLVRNRRP